MVVGQQTHPRTVAVVDCGSSAVRAYIAEVSDGSSKILEDLRYPVDLAAGVRERNLERGVMDGIERAMQSILDSARGYGCTEVRAVGTAALRVAGNADVLIERLRRRLDVAIEVIDGGEEARLYWEALRALYQRERRPFSDETVMVNLGAGHTSTALIHQGNLVHAVDDHFGTARVYDQFRDLKDSFDFSTTIDRSTLGAVRVSLGRLPSSRIDELVVTGSEVRHLLELLRGDDVGVVEPIEAARVDEWFDSIKGLTPTARAEACRTDVHSAAMLLPAASLVRHLCRETGIAQAVVPQLTLRDGLLADLMPGSLGPHHIDRDRLLAAAKSIAVRYGMNLAYAENTASLAAQIFDQTKHLHQGGDRERTLLEFAALVHDVGAFIDIRNRHKHSLYILQSVDIAGLTGLERQIVAHVARYHRRSEPKTSHASFMVMPRHARVIVSQLAAILRLAYALDVERTERVKKVRCEVVRGRLLLHVDSRQVAFEEWSVREKSDLFHDVFGLKVSVVPMERE